jgi:hypothetical protein
MWRMKADSVEILCLPLLIGCKSRLAAREDGSVPHSRGEVWAADTRLLLLAQELLHHVADEGHLQMHLRRRRRRRPAASTSPPCTPAGPSTARNTPAVTLLCARRHVQQPNSINITPLAPRARLLQPLSTGRSQRERLIALLAHAKGVVAGRLAAAVRGNVVGEAVGVHGVGLPRAAAPASGTLGVPAACCTHSMQLMEAT